MRRYSTMIAAAVVLSSLLLSGGHLAAAYGDNMMASATPGEKPVIKPAPYTDNWVASVTPGEKPVVTRVENPLAGGETTPVYPKPEMASSSKPLVGGETKPVTPVPSSADDAAAAALVTDKVDAAMDKGLYLSSPPPEASSKVAAPEKVDGEARQWAEAMPWIPDEPVKSKSPNQVAAGKPEVKPIEEDFYASLPNKPQMPPTVAAVEQDEVYSFTNPTPKAPAAATAASYTPSTPAAVSTPTPSKQSSTAMPAAEVSSSPSKQYSPAMPAAAATATPSKQSSSSSSSSSSSPATKPAVEQMDGLNEKAVNDIVKEHNMFRAREHVPPIQWNATLASYAQEYAERRRGDCKLEHSTGPYGENMMYGPGGGQWTWKRTVDEWSDEKKSYDYNTNSCTGGQMCQHYTAVVWKNTTAVGCGRVVCSSGDTLMVCSYWPPGNYIGQKPF